MERVQGIGGFFFRAKDPTGLARWYEEVLGVNAVPDETGGEAWVQREGETAFAPIDMDSPIPGSPDRVWTINIRVDDLAAMAAQIREAGSEVEIDPAEYPYGLFGWTSDPEGNRVELWQPK
jgi:glyoxylase I family protein